MNEGRRHFFYRRKKTEKRKTDMTAIEGRRRFATERRRREKTPIERMLRFPSTENTRTREDERRREEEKKKEKRKNTHVADTCYKKLFYHRLQKNDSGFTVPEWSIDKRTFQSNLHNDVAVL